jgi:hypothetical protein
MASEIFLGPDGGPYVSVNENNGDIELKDNSGNVVAFWDESNTQWDFQSNGLTNLASVSTDDIAVNDNLYYVQGDADLDAALNNATDGDLIILAPATYTTDRTLDTELRISGTKGAFDNAEIDAEWTITQICLIENVSLIEQSSGDAITIEIGRVVVDNVNGQGIPNIQANTSEVILTRLKRLDVTFASGTSNGIVDSSVTVGVTDNGTNTVGDNT